MEPKDAINAAITTAAVVSGVVTGQSPGVGDALQVAQDQQLRERMQHIEQATRAAGQPNTGGGI